MMQVGEKWPHCLWESYRGCHVEWGLDFILHYWHYRASKHANLGRINISCGSINQRFI